MAEPKNTERLTELIIRLLENQPADDCILALEAVLYGFKKAKEQMRHIQN